jgi:hypothetical protein
LSRISWQETQNASVLVISMAQLNPPRKMMPPKPPAISRAAAGKRVLGRRNIVQMPGICRLSRAE